MENKKRKLFIELDFSKKQGYNTDASENVLRDAITKITAAVALVSQQNGGVEIKFDIWTNPED